MNRTRGLRLSSRPIISKFLFVAVALALTVTLTVAQAQAQATTFNSNFRVPSDFFLFVPCASHGAGEFVTFTGYFHFLTVTVIDDQGGFHFKFTNQPQGLSGTGLTTGDKYQATGQTQGTFNGKVGFETTFIDNVRIVGQGPGNDFLIHETFHLTVNANGEETVFVDHVSIECRIPNYPG
jgi:hypothetical protein